MQHTLLQWHGPTAQTLVERYSRRLLLKMDDIHVITRTWRKDNNHLGQKTGPNPV